MTNKKRLGIWMDHSNAHLLEFSSDQMNADVLESNFTHQDKQEAMGRSEHVMHNKEQNEQAAFYKDLGKAILNYDEALLFGPTNAKLELLNVLKADHQFDHIKIEALSADKMTDNQEIAFVKDYFTNQ